MLWIKTVFRKFLTSTLCTSSLFFEFTCTVFSVKFVFNLTSTSRPDCRSKPENLESAWRETTVSCKLEFLYIFIFCLTWISRQQLKKIHVAEGFYSAILFNKLACINTCTYLLTNENSMFLSHFIGLIYLWKNIMSMFKVNFIASFQYYFLFLLCKSIKINKNIWNIKHFCRTHYITMTIKYKDFYKIG